MLKEKRSEDQKNKQLKSAEKKKSEDVQEQETKDVIKESAKAKKSKK